MNRYCLLAGFLICSAISNVHAGCPKFEDINLMVDAYIAHRPIKAVENLTSMIDAYCTQGRLAAQISRSKGLQAGFKASFTSVSTRAGTNVDRPLYGYLFQNMFLRDGAVIPANFGSRPRYAADLIAVAKDDGLTSAQTPMQALEHIEHFLPFIDLSDLIVDESASANMLQLIATNLGSRWGVLGKPIAVEATQEFLTMLETMTIVMQDQNGETLGQGHGNDVLGHPMKSVMWIVTELEHAAQRVQQGDKLGVGAFFSALQPKAGQKITVTYRGLPGDPTVSVKFE